MTTTQREFLTKLMTLLVEGHGLPAVLDSLGSIAEAKAATTRAMATDRDAEGFSALLQRDTSRTWSATALTDKQNAMVKKLLDEVAGRLRHLADTLRKDTK